MGAACSSAADKGQRDQHANNDILEPIVDRQTRGFGEETASRRGPKKEGSLFRVGSFITRRRSSRKMSMDAAPSSNKRASNYDHVHDAVMHNFTEAGVLDSGLPGGVVGLRNLGNTCFINSSLQCLSNTIPLTDYFLGYDYRKEINKENFLGTGGKLATAYAELMKEMWLTTNARRVVQPSSFKRSLSTFAPQFNGNRQHDAQELLSYLLDGIHEDLNRVKKRPYIEDKDCDGENDENDAQEAWSNYLRRNKSLVVDIFQGQFRNTCTCMRCGHKNIRFEPSMYLSLPISDSCKSLEDCLALFLEEEELTGDNKWYCEMCKTHTDATKKTDIWVLPPILIIHLKRFKHDAYGRAGRKNDAVLRYPIKNWDLSDAIRSRGGGTPLYDLYAVSNHLGSLGGGHYTAYALNRFNDLWYEFNDSSYRTIDPQTTFAKSSSPYLLFYNRTATQTGERSLHRGLLIRRQSVSRPELWPHSEVREGDFRDFQRSNRTNNETVPGLGSLEEEELPVVTQNNDVLDKSNSGDQQPAAQQNGKHGIVEKRSKSSDRPAKSSKKHKRRSKSSDHNDAMTKFAEPLRRSERLKKKNQAIVIVDQKEEDGSVELFHDACC